MAEQNEEDLVWLRREIICAIAEDEGICKVLVLKGGNALALVHGFGARTSLDLDYSLKGYATVAEADLGQSILRALTNRLSRTSLRVFDWKFLKRPSRPSPNRPPGWGGFRGEFKVVGEALWDSHDGQLEQLRKVAWGVAPGGGSSRIFKLDLSGNEWTEGAEIICVEDIGVLVYSLPLMTAEKLRALCQQMAEYPHVNMARPRPRDYFDLHALVTEGSVNLKSSEFMRILREVFAAKEVELSLLQRLPAYREYHREGWASVVDSIPLGSSRDFDNYANFVEREVQKLEPLGNV